VEVQALCGPSSDHGWSRPIIESLDQGPTDFVTAAAVGEKCDFVDHPISLLGRAASQSREQNLELWPGEMPPAMVHRLNYGAELRVPGVASDDKLFEERDESRLVLSNVSEESRGEFSQFQLAVGVRHRSSEGPLQ
jgi:hypothetical protein